MKKLSISIFIISLMLISYLTYNAKSTSANDKYNMTESKVSNTKKQEKYKKLAVKTFATEEIRKLSIINKQCKNMTLDFNTQVKNIQKLIDVFEQQLKQGKTQRELLAYSGQYNTFYRTYINLLLQAKINAEKTKYTLSSDLSILNHWHGLSVIEEFSTQSISTIVEELGALESMGLDFNISLTIKEDVNKADVYELLDNNDNFTTYLESPLSIAGTSVISPSILFVLNAERLTLNEFRQVISLHSFTVNDVAVGIKNNLSIEYLKVLIKNTENLTDMPIFAQGKYDSYSNLADLAVSEYNVELLKFLSANGIKPINELGIITGMDIAIMHLPRKAKHYQNEERFPQKHLNTLAYLQNNGYKAHGKSRQNAASTVITFKAPNRRNFQSQLALDSDLQSLLQQIELIGSNANIQQIEQNDSVLSNAIKTIAIKKDTLNNSSEVCSDIHVRLLAAEGFSTMKNTYKTINEVSKEVDDASLALQSIDPVLVHIWRNMEMARNSNDDFINQESVFTKLLRDNQYQQALDYSVSTPLTQQETDLVLSLLLDNTDQLISIWNVRISPKPPSSLIIFKYLPADKWQHLLDEGFDFSITDTWGNDIFIPALLNSAAALNFLLDNRLSTDVEKLGLDVLDIALEESYQQGRLNANINKIVKMVAQLEPNHYARIARLKKFFPIEYEKLVSSNKALIPAENIAPNEYRFDYY